MPKSLGRRRPVIQLSDVQGGADRRRMARSRRSSDGSNLTDVFVMPTMIRASEDLDPLLLLRDEDVVAERREALVVRPLVSPIVGGGGIRENFDDHRRVRDGVLVVRRVRDASLVSERTSTQLRVVASAIERAGRGVRTDCREALLDARRLRRDRRLAPLHGPGVGTSNRRRGARGRWPAGRGRRPSHCATVQVCGPDERRRQASRSTTRRSRT